MLRAWRKAAPAAGVAAAAMLAALCGGAAGRSQPTAPAEAPAGVLQAIQGLTVLPVSIELAPGQMTTTLTLQNHTSREAVFQVRPYAWEQASGGDALGPTDILVASPPLGRVPSGGEQVVRLVLRRPAEGREVSYRILLDQVPPAPEPGAVTFALRLSIPVFVEPASHVAPHVSWSVESSGGALYLVGVNSGGRRDVVRNLALATAGGRQLAIESNVSPYILAGATRRWRIQSIAPPREALRLTAHAEAGAIDQTVPAASAGP